MPETVPLLTSTITCPHCGASKTETMPTDACLFFYECTSCGKLLRPKPGDCCVFCSYGDIPCPPIQASRAQTSGLTCCAAEPAPTLEIRPGVERPDWSVVKSPASRAALGERDARRSALARAWSARLTPPQDQVWRKTLELFAALGRRPGIAEIGGALALSADEAGQLVRDLEEHDLASLDESASAIAYAYPLTARQTEHQVKLAGRTLHAVCAVDALGVGAMYGADVEIESSCRRCGTAISVRTADRGTAIAATRPGGTMIWYDQAYDRAAAISCCPSIAFFCGLPHLQEWRADEGAQRSGHELTLAEAFEIGRALFGPLLRLPSTRLPAP